MLLELQPMDYWNRLKFSRDKIGSNANYTYHTNVAVYCTLGGPDKVFINAINSHAFLVFDNVHSFKNVNITG